MSKKKINKIRSPVMMYFIISFRKQKDVLILLPFGFKRFEHSTLRYLPAPLLGFAKTLINSTLINNENLRFNFFKY